MAEPSAMSRRERKRNRTRAELFEAAVELVLEKGFDATTVEDITDRADYALRTFFRHFRSKEDVLFADHSELLSELEEFVASAPDDQSVLDVARQATLLITDSLEQNREFALVRNEIATRNRSVHAASLRNQHQWVRSMTQALARRLGVDSNVDLRPAAIAAAASVAVYNAAFRWSRANGDFDLRRETERNFDLIREARWSS